MLTFYWTGDSGQWRGQLEEGKQCRTLASEVRDLKNPINKIIKRMHKNLQYVYTTKDYSTIKNNDILIQHAGNSKTLK